MRCRLPLLKKARTKMAFANYRVSECIFLKTVTTKKKITLKAILISTYIVTVMIKIVEKRSNFVNSSKLMVITSNVQFHFEFFEIKIINFGNYYREFGVRTSK
jgi:hypothetical protein